MNEQERELLKAEIRQELLEEMRNAKKTRSVSQFGKRTQELIKSELGTDNHTTYVVANGIYAIVRNSFCVNTVANLIPAEEEEALKMAAAIIEMMKIKRERYFKER